MGRPASCPRVARGLTLCWLLLGIVPAHATIGIAYQMLLGNPSNASAHTNVHSHYLIQRDVEALDYNDTRRQPNWASWNLTTDDTGTSGRSPDFFADTNLPPDFYWVQPTDYSGSGYDRGHLCPSGDRTVSVALNEETFLMSNMMPQAPDNNQGVWANLETYCRTLAAAGNEVLITCGPEGFSGASTASAGQILIASNVWKIIVVVPTGSGDSPSSITTATRVIAVNIPNLQGVRSDPWENYLTSVNHLQTNTSFTFFTALNANVATVLRAKVDGAPACGITDFAPVAGNANSTVVIDGTNFTGATTVSFNGLNASFTFNSAERITATVPLGAITGPISVIAAGGLATTKPFTVTSTGVDPPKISIARVGSYIVLAWPSSATGFALQQTADLNATPWTNYIGNVLDDGTTKTTTITNSPSSVFFRLIAPAA